jgi:flagellar hook protein FlgE
MSQAGNAIEAYTEALNAVQANIANMQTPGYKNVSVSFQSIFDNLLRNGTPAATNSNLGGTNPLQIGSGMASSGSTLDFSQGAFSSGGNLDLAISGNGFFIISADGTNPLYTKAGRFQYNNGSIETLNGEQLYGFYGDSSALIPITGLNISDTSNLKFDADGKLMNGSDDTGWRIALTSFSNPGGLIQASGTTFQESIASGSAQTPVRAGGAFGSLTAQSFEGSNTVYVTESLKALELEKALNANLSMVKMASDVISSFISKLS